MARVPVDPAYFELGFGFGDATPLALGDGAVLVHGVIDRIDLLDDDPHLAVVIDYKSSAGMSQKELAEGKLKRVMELANKLGARFTLIVGENEMAAGRYALKDMSTGEQKSLTRDEIAAKLAAASN